MKVWKLWNSARSLLLNVCSDKDTHFHERFKGEPLSSCYEPIQLKVQRVGTEEDFPNLSSGTLLFSKRAQAALRALVTPYAEFLEVNGSELAGIEVELINVTNVVDALDHDRTEFKYDACTGTVSGFNRLQLQLDKVVHNPIFRLPEKPADLYVTDAFRDLVIKHELKGLIFEEVWSSEDTVDMEQARQQQYEDRLAIIERNKGEELSFQEALALVEADKAMASGKWKLQAHPATNVILGELMPDGDYEWIEPMVYPPMLLELHWHEVGRSEIAE
ncbi:hypothetical protein PaecuDRAFT_3698 [Paenibacillus curdlanolyticus YK9]|uniref:Immunity MXAN-0049 protein domain-containing protein n=1 Tax=Paenibacillus curdlanolyticus YK9 TaxID=717606 RepID=E0IDJ4_9BACL|nr:DUF1629 domain-containing protein [Paenibacillus curdlanolyticus]EFM09649.1 hypothetical protein PaecuDRAFT_3698 [Paenibacillus curdlanolyticus YK9]